MARRQREFNGKVFTDDGSGRLFNAELKKYLIYRPYPLLVDEVNESDKIEPDNKQEYTSKQLKDKFGTDDTSLINAGKEKEEQVSKVEDKVEDKTDKLERATNLYLDGNIEYSELVNDYFEGNNKGADEYIRDLKEEQDDYESKVYGSDVRKADERMKEVFSEDFKYYEDIADKEDKKEEIYKNLNNMSKVQSIDYIAKLYGNNEIDTDTYDELLDFIGIEREYIDIQPNKVWNDEEKSQMEEYSYNEDIQSLGDELNLDYEDIEQLDENNFTTSDGAEYVVYDEEEADNAARESIENSIDDMGIEAFSENFQNWILENALDKDFFEEAMNESNDYYASDIASEPDSIYDNRLIQEAYEAGVLSDDDFEVGEDGEILYNSPTKDIADIHDEYVEYLNNREDDPIEWYKSNYGDESLSDLIKDNRINLDIDAIVEECIKWDGRGHFISSYDGEEIELNNGKYAYRIN